MRENIGGDPIIILSCAANTDFDLLTIYKTPAPKYPV